MKAKKPKNSASRVAGVKRPISERLAAWFGPEKMPIRMPATHSQVRVGAATARTVAALSATRLISTVRLPPMRSSTKPNRKAPSPAVTFSTMPKTRISLNDIPKVPAA